jgi:arylsulfatase A-like enzyme
LGHKAPHDPFQYHPRHANILTNIDVPEPSTLHDDLAGRPAAALSTQRIKRILGFSKQHLPESAPDDLNNEELYSWFYQTFLKSYLRCVAAIDENVGRWLDYLDDHNLTENTIVVYTSDHGFFLGEHGFYDKRYMYEPSIRIPFLVSYPREIPAGTSSGSMALNVDFAPTLLDLADFEIPQPVQGQSLRSILRGDSPPEWRSSMYYRYWMHGAHLNVPAHYGVRTENHKLIYYYGDPLNATGTTGGRTEPTWELFDLKHGPDELLNL